jgi:hypothetical protein
MRRSLWLCADVSDCVRRSRRTAPRPRPESARQAIATRLAKGRAMLRRSTVPRFADLRYPASATRTPHSCRARRRKRAPSAPTRAIHQIAPLISNALEETPVCAASVASPKPMPSMVSNSCNAIAITAPANTEAQEIVLTGLTICTGGGMRRSGEMGSLMGRSICEARHRGAPAAWSRAAPNRSEA